MSILVDRCLSRSRLVEELVENWQMDHQRAMLARDMEELVCECLELQKLLHHTWTTTLERLFDEQVDNVESAGEMLRSAINRTRRTLERVHADLVKAQEQGYTISNAENLAKSLTETKQIAEDCENTWPKLKLEMVQASLADYAKGAYQETGKLIGESQGCGSTSH
jgi:hypothetical protein